jgi:hypothetical protein
MFTSSERAQIAAEVGATTTWVSRSGRSAKGLYAWRSSSMERAVVR